MVDLPSGGIMEVYVGAILGVFVTIYILLCFIDVYSKKPRQLGWLLAFMVALSMDIVSLLMTLKELLQ